MILVGQYDSPIRDAWRYRSWCSAFLTSTTRAPCSATSTHAQDQSARALANGAVDKIGGGANYEKLIRPSRYRWPEWIARTTTQGLGALEALNALDWPVDRAIDQPQITAGCAVDHVRVTTPGTMPEGRFPVLDALLERLRARPEFAATSFSDYKVPRAD
jgi:hypothetical protein